MKKSSWKDVFDEEGAKPYMVELKKFIQQEREKGEVFPKEEEVFQAFQLTDFEQVKVVILGQDPYHGPGQAHGLCFSVQKGIKQPPSLKNIFRELQQDLGIELPDHGCLEDWAKQGVFLLNTTLTVRKGEPMLHQGRGWEEFTDRVIEKLCTRKDPIVFILWGKSAGKKGEMIKSPHFVLQASHPSPYSVKGFFGCRHFSLANAFLEKSGKTAVNWGLSSIKEQNSLP